ncbi:hypothetical protein [Roseiconus lacunae]|uniref:Secreted protein n=1 Tax=Roseiconus lacunae TaxID=2605694 RepID=A0ABT7PDP7_9BACT|nr:hypothetical protein [Roseiconus lacunae]MDM4014612.1 hypothetical protein [Roseiconus lacunae]
MLFVIPWVVLIVVCIIAVPIAAKLSPSSIPSGPKQESPEDGVMDEEVSLGDDFAADAGSDDFGAGQEPVLGDDAFADFK